MSEKIMGYIVDLPEAQPREGPTASRPKRRQSASWSGRWGIISPYGKPWTPQTFDSQEDAAAHLKRFWGSRTDMMRGFTFERVTVQIRRRPASTKAREIGRE